MLQVQPFETHVAEYEQWFVDHAEAFQSEILALREHMEELPATSQGIEVGIGTGKYAEALGIKEGVEPAGRMRSAAAERGIETMDAVAEALPYSDRRFDFVLFPTIMHLDNLETAMKEAYRVLKPGGLIIMGFLDRSKPIAQAYEARRDTSDFFKYATYHDPEKMEAMLNKHGFHKRVFNQSLFGALDDIKAIQAPEPGYGKGSYVVVRGVK